MTTFLIVLLVASIFAFVLAWRELDKIEALYGRFKAPFYTPSWVRILGVGGMIGVLASLSGLAAQLTFFLIG